MGLIVEIESIRDQLFEVNVGGKVAKALGSWTTTVSPTLWGTSTAASLRRSSIALSLEAGFPAEGAAPFWVSVPPSVRPRPVFLALQLHPTWVCPRVKR